MVLASDLTADPERINQLHRALAREPRRIILAYFEEADGQDASLDDLTRYVLIHEGEANESDPEYISVVLHHVDLPMLSDIGLIEYDVETKTIRYDGPPPEVDEEAWVQVITESTGA